MAIYIINILLIIIYAILIKDKKKFTILVSIQLFLILALRSKYLGVDLVNYNDGFYYIKSLSFTDMISKLHFISTAELKYPFVYESGYVLLNWIISHLGLSFHGFLVICAFINIASFSYFIYKYSEIPWLSYIMLCAFGIYTYFFGIIRQSLALSVFLWAIHFAINNKNKRAILLFVLSFLFHRTILIMLPIFILIKTKPIKKKTFTILITLSFPFLLSSNIIYSNIVYRIMLFFGKGYTGHGIQINNLIILLYIIAISIIIFSNFKKTENNKMFNIAIWMLILSIYVEIIGMYNDNFARTMQLYNSFLLISIPTVIKQYENQRIIIIVKYIIVLLLSIFMIFSLKNSEIVPYEIEKNNIIIEK